MTRKKSSLIKDPRKPRVYLNSYMLFFLDVRPCLLDNNPKMNFSKVGRAVGELWRTLPKTTKEKYIKRAAAGRKRYAKRMTLYRKPSQKELFETYGTMPKRFCNSYGYFVKRNFDKVSRRHPALSFVQVSKRLANTWGCMSEKQKSPYVHKFIQDWRRWKREMHLYRGGHFRHNAKGCCHCCQGTDGRKVVSPVPSALLVRGDARDCKICESSFSEHKSGHHAVSKRAKRSLSLK